MVRLFFRIVAKFLGLLVVGVLIAAGVMLWRLSAGPVSIAFLTPYFEEALSSEDDRYAVRVDDTILDWSQESRTVNVKLLGARVLDADQAVVLQAPELYVSLSADALLHGEIAPRSLSVSQPSLKVTRSENGDFVFGVEGEALSASETTGWNFDEFMNGQAGRAIGYLTRVNILHAHLVIDDRLLNAKWSAPDVNITLLRTPSGVNAVTDLDLTVNDRTAAIQINADYRLADGGITISLGFTDLRPTALAAVSEKLAMLAPYDIPLAGAITVERDRDGEIVRSDFNMTGKEGRIALESPVTLDVPVDGGRFRGSYSAVSAELEVEEFTLDFPPDREIAVPAPIDHAFPLHRLTTQGTWSIHANQLVVPSFKLTLDRPVVDGTLAARMTDDGVDLDVSVKGSGFLFDDLMKYWPAKIGASPHNWISKHMPSGRVDDMHAVAALRMTADGIALQQINGEIIARELVVDYLPPMPKITKGIAHATFDAKKFDIAVLGGEALGLNAQGRAVIDNLDEKDQWTDLDLKIVGPLASVLRTLDSEPFRFARAVGLSPASAQGETTTQLKLRFIAEDRLTIDEIKMSAQSEIRGASLPSVAFGLPMTDGTLKLVLDNNGLDVTGMATVGGLPSELQWRQNFSKKAPFATRYRVKGTADAAVWREKTGLNFAMLGPDVLAGSIGADIDATLMADGKGTVAVELMLDDASLTLQPLGYAKAIGDAARASLVMNLSQGKVSDLSKIVLNGKDLVVDAAMTFTADGKFSSARIARFVAGETDIGGSVRPDAGGYEIDLRGKAIDLKAVMEDKSPEDPNKVRGDAYAISVDVENLRLYDGRYLHGVRGTASYDGLVVREAHLTANPPDGGALRMDLAPLGQERRMTMTSDNAGGVLRAFDVNDNVVGGRLDVAGTYAGMIPGVCFGGRISMDNFRVRNAPILARLLNVATIVGLVDVLRGEGIGFDTLRGSFTKKDGVTRFENAKANGLSIGLTASGSTNSREETMDIEGEIIPANVLNGLLGRIPLVGGIFGGDSGVFAINYKITGHDKEPDVSTNPLTAVTPGFTRKIFSIFDKPDDEAPVGCPKAS